MLEIVQQLYMDRFGTVGQKLEFKRKPSRARTSYFTRTQDPYTGTIHCGDGPWFVAIQAHETELLDGKLRIDYRIASSKGSPLEFEYSDRQVILSVPID